VTRTPGPARLLEGRVSHSRLASRPHAFAYRLFMLRVDLDDVERLGRTLWTFGTRRWSPVRFDAADFMGVTPTGSPADRIAALRSAICASVAAEGLAVAIARIEVVAHVRIAGYVFNPVSFFLCYEAGEEQPAAIVADVRNTFGERHAYVIPADRSSAHDGWRAKKVFHVSPFFTLDGTYRFKLDFSDGAVDAAIDLLQDGRPAFLSRLRLAPRPLTDAALVGALVRFPLMTAHVIGAIHWEALRLWRKGVTYHPKPAYDPVRARDSSLGPGDSMLASPGARADRSLHGQDRSVDSTWLDRAIGRAAQRRVIAGLDGWRHGRLSITLPDGGTVVLGRPDAEPHASVEIVRHRFFRRLLMHGDIGAGDAYIDGDWRTDDLALVVDLALRNQREAPLDSLVTRLANLADTWRHRRQKNTTDGSRRNIYAHYDLGNAFFALFLDPTMAYSSARFVSPADSLDAAQIEKYRHWGEVLAPSATDHVLEIGSGWGGLAIHLARTYGCRVTSITVSEEQRAEAVARVEAAGLAGRVSIELSDYRHVTGRFDRVVSIEMIEAVGREFWPAFFETIDRVLAPGGRVGLQAITIPDSRFDRYVASADWIQKHIFPGGLLPCLREICAVTAARTRLAVTSVEDRPLDYARTLKAWRTRFFDRLDDVRRLGVDERFIRTWEYYLASCEAAFRTRNLGLVHLVLARVGDDLT
jgi:cyclopropane-fatty-acyl-phospholipid synthase